MQLHTAYASSLRSTESSRGVFLLCSCLAVCDHNFIINKGSIVTPEPVDNDLGQHAACLKQPNKSPDLEQGSSGELTPCTGRIAIVVQVRSIFDRRRTNIFAQSRNGGCFATWIMPATMACPRLITAYEYCHGNHVLCVHCECGGACSTQR